jgi:hypothetical protein
MAYPAVYASVTFYDINMTKVINLLPYIDYVSPVVHSLLSRFLPPDLVKLEMRPWFEPTTLRRLQAGGGGESPSDDMDDDDMDDPQELAEVFRRLQGQTTLSLPFIAGFSSVATAKAANDILVQMNGNPDSPFTLSSNLTMDIKVGCLGFDLVRLDPRCWWPVQFSVEAPVSTTMYLVDYRPPPATPVPVVHEAPKQPVQANNFGAALALGLGCVLFLTGATAGAWFCYLKMKQRKDQKVQKAFVAQAALADRSPDGAVGRSPTGGSSTALARLPGTPGTPQAWGSSATGPQISGDLLELEWGPGPDEYDVDTMWEASANGSKKLLKQSGFHRRDLPNGSVYVGNLVNGRAHGLGRIDWPSAGKSLAGVERPSRHADCGSCYDGQWWRGVPRGSGYMRSGNCVYSGEFKGARLHGIGRCEWLELQQWYDGDWVDGKPHGLGEYGQEKRQRKTNEYMEPPRQADIWQFHDGNPKATVAKSCVVPGGESEPLVGSCLIRRPRSTLDDDMEDIDHGFRSSLTVDDRGGGAGQMRPWTTVVEEPAPKPVAAKKTAMDKAKDKFKEMVQPVRVQRPRDDGYQVILPRLGFTVGHPGCWLHGAWGGLIILQIDPTGALAMWNKGQVRDLGKDAIEVLPGAVIWRVDNFKAIWEYRYYRFVPLRIGREKPGNAVQIGAIAFQHNKKLVDLDGAIVTNPGGNNPDSGDPANAIDESPGTNWLDFNQRPLVIDFGAPTKADKFRFTTASVASGAERQDVELSLSRDPVAFCLDGSTDGRKWTTLYEEADYPTPTSRHADTEWCQFQVAPGLTVLSNDHGQTSAEKNTIGEYFNFDRPSGWTPGMAQVKQFRMEWDYDEQRYVRKQIWCGQVVWWHDGDPKKRGASSGDSFGRRYTDYSEGNWEEGDIVETKTYQADARAMLGMLQNGKEDTVLIETRNPPHYFFGHLRESLKARKPVWDPPNPLMSEKGYRPWLEREGLTGKEDECYAEAQLALEDGTQSAAIEARMELENASFIDAQDRDYPGAESQDLQVIDYGQDSQALSIYDDQSQLRRASTRTSDIAPSDYPDFYTDADEPVDKSEASFVVPGLVNAPPPIVEKRAWYNQAGPIPSVPSVAPTLPRRPPPKAPTKAHHEPPPIPPPPRRVADIGVAVTFTPKRGEEQGPSLPSRVRQPVPIRPTRTLVASVRPPEGIGPGRPGCPALSRPVQMNVGDATVQNFKETPQYVSPDDPTPPMTPRSD